MPDKIRYKSKKIHKLPKKKKGLKPGKAVFNGKMCYKIVKTR